MLIGKTLLISDPVANSIYASGPPEHLRILNEIMDELDHRPQQIVISALIGDYQSTDNRGFSLEAAFRGRSGDGSGGLFGQIGASPGLPVISTTTTNNNNNANTTTTTNNILDPRVAIGAAANYAVGNGFSFYGGIHQGLDMLVNTLETDTNFKVLARPTIFTQNNTPATLTSGQSFPIAASTQSSLVGGVNNNSFLSNVQYQDIVLSLNIIPLINSEDELTLQISQQNSERAGSTTITDNVYPIISKQELNTVIACRNNSTVLLGGLIRNDENKTGSRVPILASIPVLNKILGSRTRDRSVRELLIFIQPRIVKGLDDLPPSIHDSVGASAFGDEAQAAFRLERNAQDRERLNATLETEKPRFTQRMKTLLNRIILND
jgi:type II secretory pathway component GspD/PulD (secretin)